MRKAIKILQALCKVFKDFDRSFDIRSTRGLDRHIFQLREGAVDGADRLNFHASPQSCGRWLHLRLRFWVATYKFSTFVLAHGVFRRNFRLDCTDGSLLKHRILIRRPNSSQPKYSTRLFRIVSRVIPCSGSLPCCSPMCSAVPFLGDSPRQPNSISTALKN